MTEAHLPTDPPHAGLDAILVLADGTAFWGKGCGAEGEAVGEVCFNTTMTGYQEVLTDPSYAGQIITFTFPHIGNVGCNAQDIESTVNAARGFVLRNAPTPPSNWRAETGLDDWARAHGLIGISGIDTRRLTRTIRKEGAPNGVIAFSRKGAFDLEALWRKAREWPGLEGMDLARDVSCTQTYHWDETLWRPDGGYGRREKARARIVVIDYGVKRNILRALADAGAEVTVVPATASAADILAHAPDGVFLANGPGDPAATAEYAVPVIKDLLATDKPLGAICLGHQLLALALGGATEKMHQGHRGANHPVKVLATGKVQITSMNHGFTVTADSLPEGVRVSEVSLFDGSVSGLEVEGRRVFSVQQHPEASPGPQDSLGVFDRFVAMAAGDGDA